MAKTEVLAAYGTTWASDVAARANVEGEWPVLVRAAAQGDEEAWSQLVDRFNGLLWAVTWAHRLRHGDAADVVQVTWTRLVENLERIRDPEHVGAWLATTARRECLRVLDNAGRAWPMEEPPELAMRYSADSGPEVAVLASERDVLLQRAMRELCPRCQRLLNLLIAPDQPSYAEVSAALDLPIGSIGPTRARCLDCLRRHALRLGLADAAEESV
ncbi:MAG: RNA polymerase sigma factor [Egibacteraceae bacterium]